MYTKYRILTELTRWPWELDSAYEQTTQSNADIYKVVISYWFIRINTKADKLTNVMKTLYALNSRFDPQYG